MNLCQANPLPCKSKTLQRLEYVLLILCFCVLAIRATYTECPHTSTVNVNLPLSNRAFSLIISSVLILSAILWVVVSFCSGRVFYRLSGIEAGAVIFFAAAIISGLAAPDKRAAITDAVTIGAAILTALLLVQILDSPAKIKLLFFVVIALGAVNFYQCADQFFSSNQMTIDQYEQDPAGQLRRLGIEADSFRHMLYEHRLYSKDVKGFFTTSNSAGSFMLLVLFAALAYLFRKTHIDKAEPSGKRLNIIPGLLAVVVLLGLLLTQSKGAIIAAVLAGVMLMIYLFFGNWLNRRRKVIFSVCVLLVILTAALIVRLGLARGGLPGGNSMLVRWQYWQGAVKMYADKPLTGIGGANFASLYLRYKQPAALETVTDPHNFLLSILTQYGPLGLTGFLAAFLLPMLKMIFSKKPPTLQNANRSDKPVSLKACLVAGLVIVAVLLVSRPILLSMDSDGAMAVMIFAIFYLFVMPVIIFAIGFCLLCRAELLSTSASQGFSAGASVCLFCALTGAVIANIIDFAIFEPGILTLFWVTTACMVALGRTSRTVMFTPGATARIAVAAITVIAGGIYFHYAVMPQINSGAKIQQALRNRSLTHRLLAEAGKDDLLDPAPLNLNGRAYLQHYNETAATSPELLEYAAVCFSGAIKRSPADFRNYDKLSHTYRMLAESRTTPQSTDWWPKAYIACQDAIERYPGSARLRIDCAQLAERLGMINVAVENYKKAIQIEDSYRRQFREMFPDKKMFSRLGEEKYRMAKSHIAELEKSKTDVD